MEEDGGGDGGDCGRVWKEGVRRCTWDGGGEGKESEDEEAEAEDGRRW